MHKQFNCLLEEKPLQTWTFISLMFSRQFIMNQFYELQNTESIMQELKDNEWVQYLAHDRYYRTLKLSEYKYTKLK